MIEITGIDLKEFVKKVYELSIPQGLGFLHYTSEPLSDKEAQHIVDEGKDCSYCAIRMDYVNGRACKMSVNRKGEKLFIGDSWYDHTNEQFKQLLNHFNIKLEKESEHGLACNCEECREKRLK